MFNIKFFGIPLRGWVITPLLGFAAIKGFLAVTFESPSQALGWIFAAVVSVWLGMAWADADKEAEAEEKRQGRSFK